MSDKKIDGYIRLPKNENKKELSSTDYLESISGMTESAKNLAKSLVNIQEIAFKNIIDNKSELFESIFEIAKKFSNSINIYNAIGISISKSLANFMEHFSSIVSSMDLGNLSIDDVEFLKDNYWVVPFEYNLDELNNFADLQTDFNKKIIEYFDDKRLNRIFDFCINRETKEDKKVLLEQIKTNYFLNNYAICLTSLITYLDGITLQLIDKTSYYQHNSHKAIDTLYEYYKEEVPFYNKGYEMFLKIEILKNFYDKLYCIDILKEPNFDEVNRNTNSHGARYSNEKIDVLRILNAIWFVQTIIDETDMKEKFISTKQTRKFEIINKEE